MTKTIERNDIRRTEKFAVTEDGKVVSRVYVRIPYGDKPIFIFRVKTNKTHRRRGLCKQIMKDVIKTYGKFDMELRVCSQDITSMSTKQLFKFYKKFGFRRKKR